MGIYRLDSKKISHDYPWVKGDMLHLYLIWPASEYFAVDHVASGYVETESQHKSNSMKPASFYINNNEV